MTYTPKPGDRVTSPVLVGEWVVTYVYPDGSLAEVSLSADVFGCVYTADMTLVDREHGGIGVSPFVVMSESRAADLGEPTGRSEIPDSEVVRLGLYDESPEDVREALKAARAGRADMSTHAELLTAIEKAREPFMDRHNAHLDTLAAILERHTPTAHLRGPTTGLLDQWKPVDVCEECQDDWPCPDVAAVADALRKMGAIE